MDNLQSLYDTGLTLRQLSDFTGLPVSKIRYRIKTRNKSEALKLSHDRFPRVMSETTKLAISDHMKERHTKGLAHCLGRNRHLAEPSWPEKWWTKVIENEIADKAVIREYQIGRYSIDFAWPAKKIALEIDGDQHQRFEKQILSDQRKDDFLQSEGWSVTRIVWKDCFRSPQTYIEQVKKLVDS